MRRSTARFAARLMIVLASCGKAYMRKSSAATELPAPADAPPGAAAFADGASGAGAACAAIASPMAMNASAASRKVAVLSLHAWRMGARTATTSKKLRKGRRRGGGWVGRRGGRAP